MMVGEFAYLGQQSPAVSHRIPGNRESCYQDDIYGPPCQSIELMGLPPSNGMVHAFSQEIYGLGNGLADTFGLGEDKVTAPAPTTAHFVGGAAAGALVAYMLYRSATKEGAKGWRMGEYVAAGLFGLGAVGSVLKAAGVKVPGVA
jgi:hypothetical protein